LWSVGIISSCARVSAVVCSFVGGLITASSFSLKGSFPKSVVDEDRLSHYFIQRSWLIFFAEDFILDSFLEVVIEFGNEYFVVLF
jgi:hypothetical protein